MDSSPLITLLSIQVFSIALIPVVLCSVAVIALMITISLELIESIKRPRHKEGEKEEKKKNAGGTPPQRRSPPTSDDPIPRKRKKGVTPPRDEDPSSTTINRDTECREKSE